jgi:hypothetical protein
MTFVVAPQADRQREERARVVADRRLRVWYDREGDFLEVIFEDRAGSFRETQNDHVIGFSIMKVSSLQSAPLEVALSR